MINLSTTSLPCTSMVMILIIFPLSKKVKSPLTLPIKSTNLYFNTPKQSFIAPSFPSDNSLKASPTSSVQTI